jgi:hypothetical protein
MRVGGQLVWTDAENLAPMGFEHTHTHTQTRAHVRVILSFIVMYFNVRGWSAQQKHVACIDETIKILKVALKVNDFQTLFYMGKKLATQLTNFVWVTGKPKTGMCKL